MVQGSDESPARACRAYIIDRDETRRAEIASQLAWHRAKTSSQLSGQKVFSVVCESVADFASRTPIAGVVLVHNDDALIHELHSYARSSGRQISFIVYSENPTTRQVVQALNNGAADYFGWPCDLGELVKSILAVNMGVDAQLQPDLSANRRSSGIMIDEVPAAPEHAILRLTKREHEVLTCFAGGMSNAKIGERLGISSRTVECHRAKILAKLGASNSAAAVRIALETGLL